MWDTLLSHPRLYLPSLQPYMSHECMMPYLNRWVSSHHGTQGIDWKDTAVKVRYPVIEMPPRARCLIAHYLSTSPQRWL